MHLSSVNQLALRTSLPVMFGYLPLGIAFGMLFTELDHHWLYATAMSLFMYAGAGQFLAVGLLANQAGLLEMVIATLLLNARHIFYGLSLVKGLKNRGWRRWYQIFSLTDETYSLLSSTSVPSNIDEAKLQFRLAAFNHAYWVLGCTIGAFIGSQVSFSTAGIEFVLPALFMVLTIEQYKHIREPWPFWLALSIGLGTLLLISRDHMLLIAILLSLCVLMMQRASR